MKLNHFCKVFLPCRTFWILFLFTWCYRIWNCSAC